MKESLQRLGLPLHVFDASEDFYSGTTTIVRKDGSSYETAVGERAWLSITDVLQNLYYQRS